MPVGPSARGQRHRGGVQRASRGSSTGAFAPALAGAALKGWRSRRAARAPVGSAGLGNHSSEELLGGSEAPPAGRGDLGEVLRRPSAAAEAGS
jgi:hypothetical protein